MAEPKKVVVKLNIHDDKDKKKAMKAVSCLEGINSIGVDMKESKMTVIGDVDPVQVVAKLKKQWCAQIVTVGPAKDEKKEKEEKEKKEKEEKEKKAKKEKEEKEKKEKEEKAKLAELLKKFGPLCPPPPPPPYPPYYYVQSVEENPNSCVIC